MASPGYDWELYADEDLTEVHHHDCLNTPDSEPTGDANAAGIQSVAKNGFVGPHEIADLTCECLDPILGTDRPSDPLIGKKLVVGASGTVRENPGDDQSYLMEVNLGGIIQEIVVSETYVRNKLEGD